MTTLPIATCAKFSLPSQNLCCHPEPSPPSHQGPCSVQTYWYGEDGAEVAAVADNILTHQLLVLDGEALLVRGQDNEELKEIYKTFSA